MRGRTAHNLGITVVEGLVWLALAAILVGTVWFVASRSQRVAASTESRAKALQGFHQSMTQLASDLARLAPSRDPNPLLSGDRDVSVTKQGDSSAHDRVSFVIAVSESTGAESTGATLRRVSYRLVDAGAEGGRLIRRAEALTGEEVSQQVLLEGVQSLRFELRAGSLHVAAELPRSDGPADRAEQIIAIPTPSGGRR